MLTNILQLGRFGGGPIMVWGGISLDVIQTYTSSGMNLFPQFGTEMRSFIYL